MAFDKLGITFDHNEKAFSFGLKGTIKIFNYSMAHIFEPSSVMACVGGSFYLPKFKPSSKFYRERGDTGINCESHYSVHSCNFLKPMPSTGVFAPSKSINLKCLFLVCF